MTTLTWKPGTLLPYTSLWLTLRKLAHLNKLRISDFPLSEDFSPRSKRAQSQSRSVQNVDLRVLARLMGEPVQFLGIRIKRWTEWDDSDRFEPVDSGLLGGHRVLLKVFVFHD